MRRRWAVLSAVAAVVLAAVTMLALRDGAGRDGPATAAPTAFDPPTAFAAEGAGTPLPREADGDPPPIVLDGFHAFVALPGRLQVIDTRSGAVRAEIAPGTPAGDAEGAAVAAVPRAPLLTVLGGRPVAVAAFAVQVPGRGTRVGHDAVELLAVDAATFDRAAGMRVDLPPSLSGRNRLRAAWPVGGADGVVVVAAEQGPERDPASYAVEPTSGRVRWQAPGLAAVAVTGGLVIGTEQATGGAAVTAVRLADGRPVWTTGGQDASVSAWPAGPSAVAVATATPGTGSRALALLDTSTGRVLSRRGIPGAVTCRFDGRLTTVCWHDLSGRAWAAGFDVSSGRQLWELPDAGAGRVAPRVSTAWHGAVYGSTDNGAVALDARTGTDLPRSPGIAPDLVNAQVGIVGATVERPRAKAYPAVA